MEEEKKYWLVEMRSGVNPEELNGAKFILDLKNTTLKEIDDINIIAQPASISKVKLSVIKNGKRSLKLSKKVISGVISINRIPKLD